MIYLGRNNVSQCDFGDFGDTVQLLYEYSNVAVSVLL